MKHAFLIVDQSDIKYLTGLVSSDPSVHEYCAILHENAAILCTYPLNKEFAVKTVPSTVSVNVIQRFADIALQLKKLFITDLLVDEHTLNLKEYRILSEFFHIRHALNPIREKRLIKTEKERIHITQACRITDDCFTHLRTLITPGMRETDIVKEITLYFLKKDAENAFDPIVAFDSNSSQPHYHPSNRAVLKQNSFMLLDFGAKVDGYCSDMSRMVFLQKASGTLLRAYQTVLQAQQFALVNLKQYTSGKTLDTATKKVITDAGFDPYMHGLGHGVGLDIHEAPRLNQKSDALLSPGMVITVEPGIYAPGKYGIRIEDTVYLGKNGPEILTKSPKTIDH